MTVWWTQGRPSIASSSYRGPLALFWPLALRFLHSASRNCRNIRTKSSELHGRNSSHKMIRSPGNCLCWPPTSTTLGARHRPEVRGGTAAGADVAPNCSSRHAETIPLDRFKASTIGVTARLKQLQSQSPPLSESILLKWIRARSGLEPCVLE